ncbi:glycosyltransferase family 87 protein [Trinickia mobilis]|uniref:glycosyltransferase family 87 protein n=1 Tax=Trinickia mobilis TaxID=2816356 RepID=UPI001A8D3E4E|nr:glycosyltransferase family 87 protein [Trinickia mobilis]
MNSISPRNLPVRHERPAVTLPAASPARRQHWLNSERLWNYAILALICYALFVVIYLYKAVWHPHEYITPLAKDFLAFWSSSYLALHGHAVDAYNVDALTNIESGAISHPVGILPWLYPPTFLLFVYPFALLPWKIAAALFLGGTYALFIRAIHATLPCRQVILTAAAFPGAALVAISGQNGLLTASLAALGLVLLRRRPVMAGICFGLLCMKPHLAVLVPLALLCSRSWRALAALALTAVSMLAVAVLAFGTETLAAFLHNAGMTASYIETGRVALARIPTVFVLAKLAHAPPALAYAAQSVSALAAAAAVVYAWCRESSYPLRAAVLICASLLVSPYLFDYDLAWYGVLIAWYCKYAMDRGWKRFEREWLVVLWFAPLAGVLVVMHVKFQFMPLISAITLWMLVRRIAFERREPAVLRPYPGE